MSGRHLDKWIPEKVLLKGIIHCSVKLNKLNDWEVMNELEKTDIVLKN